MRQNAAVDTAASFSLSLCLSFTISLTLSVGFVISCYDALLLMSYALDGLRRDTGQFIVSVVVNHL